MVSENAYSLGLDYGTNSVRAILVEGHHGEIIAESVFPYPSGRDGILTDPRDANMARQNPADYLRGFEVATSEVVAQAGRRSGFSPDRIVGLGIDTTGSTPIPVNRRGVPLAMTPEFRDHPAAMAWLWKDHCAHAEAEEITRRARRQGVPYLDKCGGTYSAEWFWAKILHCRRTAPEVFESAFSWVECCDFVPAWIAGNPDPLKMCRSVCAAGHKAMYSETWGGLPSAEFLRALDPGLAELRGRLYTTAVPSDRVAGHLTPEAAGKTGLPSGIPVAVGGLDAHVGAVGAGIRPGTLVKILGTSSCDMLVAPRDAKAPDIPGICGIVPGSILPDRVGLEAGQSAVGDIFHWFVENLCPPAFTAGGDVFKNLGAAMARLRPGESGLIALDWNNGNRSVLVDPLLGGLLIGQSLHTTAPEILRALFEATAFGARVIIERFEEYGVRVQNMVVTGGIAEKDPVMMQILSDVCHRPILQARSTQTCALGAGIFGAVAGGLHETVEAAQAAMGGYRSDAGFEPSGDAGRVYDELYSLYRDLHDAFGKTGRHPALDGVMKKLIAIRERVRFG